MTFAQSPVSTAIAGEVSPVSAPVSASAAAPVRVKPLPYSEAQALAFWTAKSTEDKGAALWGAVSPLISAYLVNGGTAASLRNSGKAGAMSQLASHIHANRAKRDRAAQLAFSVALADFKPRACEYDQAAHDGALDAIEGQFYQVIAPTVTERKPQAIRYSVAQLVELAQTGALDSESGAALYAALSAYASAGAKVSAPVMA